MIEVTKNIINDEIRWGIENDIYLLKILADNTPTKITPYYNGHYLVESNAVTKEVQRRTHRKRRINKKWLKRYGHKTVLDNGNIIRCGDCLFATSKTVEKIIAAMKGGAE